MFTTAGTVILIQRDWIVVIANGDKDNLAKMNSVLRTIELTTYMVAPIVVGQLFHFAGYIFTGFFIAGWNVVSVALEYLLLNRSVVWSGQLKPTQGVSLRGPPPHMNAYCLVIR